MELIKPTTKYRESFIETLKEFEGEGTSGFWNVGGWPASDLDGYIQRTEDYANGVGLPEGWVRATTYWLINHEDFIGHVNIRHELTEKLQFQGGHIGYAIRPKYRNQGYGKKILELSLSKAKEIGLDKALVTCNRSNEASCKIIETNGGELFETEEIKDKNDAILRFWIVLP